MSCSHQNMAPLPQRQPAITNWVGVPTCRFVWFDFDSTAVRLQFDRRHCSLNKIKLVREPPQYAPALYPPSVGAEAPRADSNVVGSHGEYVPTVTAAAAWCVKAAVSQAAWWPWPLDLESGVRVMCDVRYLCATFSLPMPTRPDVRDRQRDVRQHHIA